MTALAALSLFFFGVFVGFRLADMEPEERRLRIALYLICFAIGLSIGEVTK